ncbi:MAG: two-component system, NtrC family, sensor kinase [Pseudomonadota bacterium]|nr:two-component system, NtrC family, sensor kinase [Pseudomonadota bacterium]
MNFEAFAWGPRFECGIAIIDGQHQRLVELINRLGEVLINGNADLLLEIVAEARAYAGYHFRTEEGVWESAGIAPEAQAIHQEAHLDFVAQLDNFVSDLTGAPAEVAALLHGYLSSWLIFHILGDDHALARRVLANSPNRPVPAPPPELTSPPLPSTTEDILLGALHKLYETLTKMNTQLRDTNRSLDTRVRERTQALESANEALVQERDLLAAANFQLDETRSRLLESEKLASIGQLAAGVAHEINNPIGFVNSNLGTLGEYLDDTFAVLDAYAAVEPLIARDPQAIAAVRAAKSEREIAFVREDAKSLLAESRDGLSRVRNIVQDLKTFSHVDQSAWQKVDLRAGLESTVNIVWNELRQKAELRREFNDIPPVVCNAGQINQVFMNLLTNAAQAINGHGVITVRTGSADNEVWIEVEDDGCGISTEHQQRIFDPFFTTKPIGQGTGLGLSMAWGIVQKHGGRIEVESTPGKGSCFRICLPKDGPPADKAESEKREAP